MRMDTSLTIGQLARSAGVGIDTIRFYERQNLIPAPPRRASGYRQYPPETIARLQFIRRAKELGFSLKEISTLMSFRIGRDTTCVDVRNKAEEKIQQIESKIKSLHRMKGGLQRLAASCRGEGPASECPILEALEGS